MQVAGAFVSTDIHLITEQGLGLLQREQSTAFLCNGLFSEHHSRYGQVLEVLKKTFGDCTNEIVYRLGFPRFLAPK